MLAWSPRSTQAPRRSSSRAGSRAGAIPARSPSSRAASLRALAPTVRSPYDELDAHEEHDEEEHDEHGDDDRRRAPRRVAVHGAGAARGLAPGGRATELARPGLAAAFDRLELARGLVLD